MRIYIIISLIILLNQLLFAQQKTEVYYGVSNRIDYANDILEMYDGGYYISGGFEYEKGWNIKTDINLELLWDQTFEFPSFPIYNNCSVSDSDGNTYTGGSTMGWPFVTKIDSCGQKQWCKILKYHDEFNYGFSTDITMSPDNEIVLLTYFDSDEEIVLIHLLGLNKNGDVLWKKPYASRNDYPWIREASGRSIKLIEDEYYISGYCYWPYPNDTNQVFLRPLFIGIDSVFNEKWILPFAPLDSVYGEAYKTIALNDSVFMGVGIRRWYNSEVFSLLMFYNKDGEELGYNQITNDQIGPDNKRNHIRDIARINDTLFLAAVFYGPENSGNPVGEFIIDTAANLYNFESRPNTVSSPKLIKTSDNNYVIATSIQETKSDWDIYVYKIDEDLQDVPFDPTPHNYDSLCPGGIQSGIIDLSDCLIWTDIGEVPSPNEYYTSIKTIPITAYPNPATEGSITFEFENTEHHQYMELKCIDIFGKAVHSEKVYRYQEESKLDVGTWGNGIYIGVVYSNGLAVGQCKFVIQ